MKLITILAGAAILMPCFPTTAEACRRDRVKVRPACHTAGYHRPVTYRAPVRSSRHYDRGRHYYRPGRPFVAGALTGAALTAAFVDNDWRDRRYRRGYYHRGYGRASFGPHYYRSSFYGPRAGIGFGVGPRYWW